MGLKAPVRTLGPRWSDLKARLDIVAVATSLLGPPFRKRGIKSLWHCPFHEDSHPSFEVNPDPKRRSWRCWVCGIGGDAGDLVQRVRKVDSIGARDYLAGLLGDSPGSPAPRPATLAPKAPVIKQEKPTGLPATDSPSVVNGAVDTLWGPDGSPALGYLRSRGLADETIREFRLGFVKNLEVPRKGGPGTFPVTGITIPWFDGERLTRIKIRRTDGRNPKYVEAYSDRPLIYPDPEAIRPGEPLIICEGELDAVLLAQQLPEASVITLGSASARGETSVISRMLASPSWFAATGADEAGDNAASKFPARAIRVRPPDKDWTDTHAGGFSRIRYHWGAMLPLPTFPDGVEFCDPSTMTEED